MIPSITSQTRSGRRRLTQISSTPSSTNQRTRRISSTEAGKLVERLYPQPALEPSFLHVAASDCSQLRLVRPIKTIVQPNGKASSTPTQYSRPRGTSLFDFHNDLIEELGSICSAGALEN